MIKLSIPSKFVQDWSPAAESYMTDIDQGIEYKEPVKSTIDKIDGGKVIKRGKGYTILVELTEDEARFLKQEAFYRYEFNSTNEYGVEDKDYVAGRAARKIYDALTEAGI